MSLSYTEMRSQKETPLTIVNFRVTKSDQWDINDTFFPPIFSHIVKLIKVKELIKSKGDK